MCTSFRNFLGSQVLNAKPFYSTDYSFFHFGTPHFLETIKALYEIETISKMNNYAIIYDMISLSACAYSDVETN